jgi:WD40 repeat protein
MTDLCKIIDTIDVTKPSSIIQTPCGKFLIGVEYHSIFSYCLLTKQKFQIAGSIIDHGYKDGIRDESRFHNPSSLTLSKDLKTLFIIDKWNYVIRTIRIGTGVTTTFAGQVDNKKFVDGPKEKACFKLPSVLKLSPDGNTLYVADFFKFRSIHIETGQVNTIDIFENIITDFTLSPDGKYIYICYWFNILKYNFETGKSEIVLEGKGIFGCDISKDGQLLFILNYLSKIVKVVKIVTNQVIDTITTPFMPSNLTVSTNAKQIFVCDCNNATIKVLDISKYCTNFKTFLQSQLCKHSFLSRLLIKRFN